MLTILCSSASEAKELLRERWFRKELLNKRRGGRPIWDGLSPLAARSAHLNEQQHFEINSPADDHHGGEVLRYLIPVD